MTSANKLLGTTTYVNALKGKIDDLFSRADFLCAETMESEIDFEGEEIMEDLETLRNELADSDVSIGQLVVATSRLEEIEEEISKVEDALDEEESEEDEEDEEDDEKTRFSAGALRLYAKHFNKSVGEWSHISG